MVRKVRRRSRALVGDSDDDELSCLSDVSSEAPPPSKKPVRALPPPKQPYQAPHSAPLAYKVPGVYESQTCNNVCLTFPKAGTPALELWTSSKLLEAVSPYYKTMFDSGFSEAQPVPSQSTSSLAQAAANLEEFKPSPRVVIVNDPDSDAEAAVLFKDKAVKQALIGSTRQITITEASYLTYKALLSWLHTGQISFAPLKAGYDDPATRQHEFSLVFDQEPNRPVPCSAKSMYKLAHLLEIDSLAKLALDGYISLLEPKFAHREIFSSMLHYDGARARLVEYLHSHRSSIKVAGGFTSVKMSIRKGELSEFEDEVKEILFDLI